MDSELIGYDIERDEETGRPTIAACITHPGGKPVSVDDIPETDTGRVLSDEWVQSIGDDVTQDGSVPETLAADLTRAIEDGTENRKLVVLQPTDDGYLFDESIARTDLDDVELNKGTDLSNLTGIGF